MKIYGFIQIEKSRLAAKKYYNTSNTNDIHHWRLESK